MIRRSNGLPHLIAVLLATVACQGAPAPKAAASAPSVLTSDEAVSRFGQLEVVPQKDPLSDRRSELAFRGALLDIPQGARLDPASFGIVSAFATAKGDLFLVRGDTAALACPIVWIVVEVRASGSAMASAPFGTCSGLASARLANDGVLVVQLHEDDDTRRRPRLVTYAYSNGAARPDPDRA